MARYTVEAPDGRRVTIEGDSQPTESDLEEIFKSIPAKEISSSQDSSAMDLAVGGAPGGFASGIDKGDTGAVIASAISGTTMGGLRNLIEQPLLSAVGGPAVANFQNSARASVDLANLIPGVNLENNYSQSGSFPKAKTAKGVIAQNALELGIPSFLGGITADKVTRLLDSIPNVKKAQLALDESAYKTTLRARDSFKTYAKELSDKFGADYEKAIDGVKVSKNDYVGVLDNVANEAGIIGQDKATLSTPEKKFLNYYNRIRESKDLPDNLNLSDLDKEVKGLFGNTYGRQYGSGDHVISLFRKGVSEFFSDTSKNLALVKSKYAPDLQFKNEAFKVLKPYSKSGELDAGSGINFFKRVASGNLRPDQRALLKRFVDNYDPKMLDDLMMKAKDLGNAHKLDLIPFMAKHALGGTAAAAGGYAGYRVLKKVLH